MSFIVVHPNNIIVVVFRCCFHNAGQFPQEVQDQFNAMKQELSLTGADTLNWKAFLAATMDKNLVMREDKIKMAFDRFNHSGADHLTLDDFKGMFEGEAQEKEIFDYLDTDHDGKVSFEDFRNAMEEQIDIDGVEAGEA